MEIYIIRVVSDQRDDQIAALLKIWDIAILPTTKPHTWLLAGLDYPKFNDLGSDEKRATRWRGMSHGRCDWKDEPTEQFLRDKGIKKADVQLFVSRANRARGRPNRVDTVILEHLGSLVQKLDN